tara:strand:+ start:146 stop:622 length:477 start_codon:yes stop_codon:yes gene_type:complete
VAKTSIAHYALAIVLIVGGGALSGYFSGSAGDNAWYQNLHRSALNPPGYVFGIVWPVLYACMAVAMVRVIHRSAGNIRQEALLLFVVQLLVNYAWSFIFFTAHATLVAFLVILFIIGLVTLTTQRFHRIDRTAGLLLCPYLIWLCFAAYLNATIVWLN